MGADERDLAPADVTQHVVDRPIERVAPTATAGGSDPHHLTGAHRLGVGERVDRALVRAALVDGDCERATSLAAL